MARFPGVHAAAPALAGVVAAFVSFHYFEPAQRSLTVAQVEHRRDASAGWRAEVVAAKTERPKIERPKTERPDSETPDTETPGAQRVTLSGNALGHFHITAEINGMPVDMMADTGATYVALTFKTALSLGIQPAQLPFNRATDTANGVTAVAPVMLDEVRIGGIVLRGVEAVVTPPGRMSQNLLGMSFINRLSRFEMSGRRLTLTQ